MKPIEKSNELIEHYEGKMLHPSLDIKNNVLILGFRYRSKPQGESDLYLIVKDGSANIIEGDSVKIENDTYYFEKRGRKLARIEEKWSLDNLQKTVASYPLLVKETLPPKDFLENISCLVKNYIELERDMDYLLVSAWAIGTYFFPIFYAYPFLHIKAPKRSGKSQCLNLLSQLCFNAIKAMPTLAALGDTVDALRGTYLIDQADSLDRKGGEELLNILADSYKKNGGKRRTVSFNKNKNREISEFETYGPKVFASIRELPEDLRDRCLTIPLMRSQKNFYDPDDENENWREIRGMIYKQLIDLYSFVESVYSVKKVDYRQNPKIKGRELELWLPIETMLCVLGAAEKTEEVKKRFFQWYSFSEYQPNRLEEQVIKMLLNRLGNKSEAILSPIEISKLINLDYFVVSDTPQQKATKVGWAIKKFNLSSEKMARTKDGVRYLFEKNKVEKIFAGYFEKSLSSSTPNKENGAEINNSAVQ